SAAGSERSTLVRATFSPDTVRRFSPTANSVVSISERAVESHASSGRPDRFLKPSTATERRPLAGTLALLELFLPSSRSRHPRRFRPRVNPIRRIIDSPRAVADHRRGALATGPTPAVIPWSVTSSSLAD